MVLVWLKSNDKWADEHTFTYTSFGSRSNIYCKHSNFMETRQNIQLSYGVDLIKIEPQISR